MANSRMGKNGDLFLYNFVICQTKNTLIFEKKLNKVLKFLIQKKGFKNNKC